jgi:hypothetical protein
MVDTRSMYSGNIFEEEEITLFLLAAEVMEAQQSSAKLTLLPLEKIAGVCEILH